MGYYRPVHRISVKNKKWGLTPQPPFDIINTDLKKTALTEERKKKMYYEFYRFEELVEMVAYGELTEAEAETIALELLKNND